MTVEPKSESKPLAENPTRLVFSAEDRRAIASSFCKAYLGGRIKIKAWTPGVVADMTSGEKISPEKLLENRRNFGKLIMTISGIGNPTQEEVDSAIDTIYALITAYRSGDLLEGTFLVGEQDAKFRSLESRLEALEALTLKLIEEVRMLSHIRGSNPA